jgi:hypothetical protein
LEEVVFREVFLRVMWMKLKICGLVTKTVQVIDCNPTDRSHTVQKLFTRILKMLKSTTKMTALHFALKPTTTITQATKPKMQTNTLHNVHVPETTNPMKRKISNTRPASWKYILRSLSSI